MPLVIETLDIKEKLALVCLYFARLKSDDPRFKNKWSPALKFLSAKYNVKYNTLKNNKDRFDAVFDGNGRRGWHQKPLEQQHRYLNEIYLKYKDTSIEELQLAVEQILGEAQSEGNPFFSIKTKSPEQVKKVLNREQTIEIEGLNILKEELHKGQLVFIVLGGDKGKAQVTWETGLVGIGSITKEPYDEGYDRGNSKNYKINIDVKVLLDKPIKREDLKPYNDTYNIIGIGPMLKWEPNQAISQIAEKNAVALMRAMLELSPGIEEELSVAVSDEIMARVKGSVVKLVPMELDYNEEPPQQEDQEEEALEEDFSEKYEPDLDAITKDFVMSQAPIKSMAALINIGKHIIFTGPPGTGKSTLAERACEEAVRTRYISGYFLTTAISDWTTFDTIGGYMPDIEGRLEFQEGVFLKSIRENKWLIIDEINRAEVDKAFGHFFTVLSGMDVELQYKAKTPTGEKNITIKHIKDKLGSYYDESSATYFIGRNWRIIATMNTYDKNSLFMLSYAFMRRFAFVHIDSPSETEYAELIDRELVGDAATKEILMQLIRTSPKKLGAAIILDLINLIRIAGPEETVSGICVLVIPQYEGISLAQIKRLYKDLGSKLDMAGRNTFVNYLGEFFDIRLSDLLKVKFTDEQELSEDDDIDEGDVEE